MELIALSLGGAVAILFLQVSEFVNQWRTSQRAENLPSLQRRRSFVASSVAEGTGRWVS